MPWFQIIWTDKAIQKLEEHGITQDEYEEVVFGARGSEIELSRSSGKPIIRGYTSAGRWLVCVFVYIDDITIQAWTAFAPEEQ